MPSNTVGHQMAARRRHDDALNRVDRSDHATNGAGAATHTVTMKELTPKDKTPKAKNEMSDVAKAAGGSVDSKKK